jgi:hypothetical protein
MKICKYGITLNRLRQEDIEFVREKRNSEEVRRFMAVSYTHLTLPTN